MIIRMSARGAEGDANVAVGKMWFREALENKSEDHRYSISSTWSPVLMSRGR